MTTTVTIDMDRESVQLATTAMLDVPSLRIMRMCVTEHSLVVVQNC